MKPENYLMAKQLFIDQYNNYDKLDDIGEFVHNVVIPYFDLLACDLEEIISTIKSQTESPIQVLDYIELIFNSKLYDSYLTNVSNYSHYLVILVEFIKYLNYKEIKSFLENIESKEEKPFIQEVLMKATEERSQYCMDKIKQVYQDLVNNYSNYTFSILACDELFEANNINI